VACFPYKSTTLFAFILLVKAPWRILKDFIQIMKMELVGLCYALLMGVVFFEACWHRLSNLSLTVWQHHCPTYQILLWNPNVMFI